jgi:hypothetical protein
MFYNSVYNQQLKGKPEDHDQHYHGYGVPVMYPSPHKENQRQEVKEDGQGNIQKKYKRHFPDAGFPFFFHRGRFIARKFLPGSFQSTLTKINRPGAGLEG